MSDEVPSYISLQKDIHEALRIQHPEWVEADGRSPTCDLYEARFAELLRRFGADAERSVADQQTPNALIFTPHRIRKSMVG